MAISVLFFLGIATTLLALLTLLVPSSNGSTPRLGRMALRLVWSGIGIATVAFGIGLIHTMLQTDSQPIAQVAVASSSGLARVGLLIAITLVIASSVLSIQAARRHEQKHIRSVATILQGAFYAIPLVGIAIILLVTLLTS